MSIYKKTGALLLGTRLKRLSDKFLSDLSKIYKDENIWFEASWFPVFYLLDRFGEITISNIARQLEITHSGASQMVTSLKKKGFIQISQTREDKRVKTVFLTVQGKEKLHEIRPVWHAIQESMNEMVGPGGEESRILGLLDELEEGMTGIHLVDRVQRKLRFNQFLENIEIVQYSDAFHEPFMALVLNWISENPNVLPDQTNWINDTQQEVVELGNTAVFMAVDQGQVICACVATMDGKEMNSELTLVFEKSRVSDNIVQVLLDTVVGELKKTGISRITTRMDIGNSVLLKMFQKNKFKLMEIEKSAKGNNTCTRLSRTIKEEEKIS